MASVPDSASVPSTERECGIEKTDELRRLKNARNRKFESISLQQSVQYEPEFRPASPSEAVVVSAGLWPFVPRVHGHAATARPT